jgi:transposase InsO family protein
MLAQLSAIDKVSIVALARIIQAEHKTTTIAELAYKLGVPIMSELRNRARLISRLSLPRAEGPAPAPQILALAAFLIVSLLEKTGAIRDNQSRRSYAGWLKRLCVDSHERGHPYAEISQLTGIEAGALEGFKDSVPIILKKESMEDKTKLILDVWTAAHPRHKQTLDAFLSYFLKQAPTTAVARDEMRSTLINLGLHTPRGPRIKNEGAQVKQPFAPHALWEGDGKLIKVRVNGVDSQWIWYAFIDQKTTLLVGASMTTVESAASFLDALKSGQAQAGLSPIGVLIDNRLEGSDLGPVRDFCKEHGITVVRTFPGNSKSNGIVEGNFSIFERFVGNLTVVGSTPEEIGRSVALLAVEIFTQQRNHSPRERLGGKSPHDATAGASRPEHVRNSIEALARRLDREQIDAQERWNLIGEARLHFGVLSEASEQKIKRQLIKYTLLDIVAAQASFRAQIAKHPLNKYGPEYFLAILRHKREAVAKTVYNEAYCAGLIAALGNPALVTGIGADDAADGIVRELIELAELPSPAHQMLRLDALAWWLVRYGASYPLEALWKKIEALATLSIHVSLRWWSTIVEYLGERIGLLLYKPAVATGGGDYVYKQNRS